MSLEDISEGVHLVPLDDDDISTIIVALGRLSSSAYWEVDELIERLKEIRDEDNQPD